MRVALIAHDEKKDDMVAFVVRNEVKLETAKLYATGTTGIRIMEATSLDVHRFLSGPMGGDQQIGAMVASGNIDLVVFLRDPLTAQPHEPDILALLRVCDVHQVPVATNIKSGQFLVDAMF
jgi:methylglyoxal synthase